MGVVKKVWIEDLGLLDGRIKEKELAPSTDEECILRALGLALKAADIDEVPVGAMVVCRGRIISEAYNHRESSGCATHHAEILAIEEACRVLGGWRLPHCTLYVTMEPCVMCAGAVINSRIERVVYGAPDIRFGALGSLINVSRIGFNHKMQVTGGVLEEECKKILSEYFKRKR